MNVTMIVPYFKPEITAIVRLMDDLARDLAAYGARVTVVTGFPARGISKELQHRYVHLNREQLAPNLTILRTGSKKAEGKGLIQRGARYLLKTAAFYQKAKKTNADVYYIYSTPPFMGLIGTLLHRKTPTLYCLQDIFPDNLVLQGKLRKKGRVYRFLSQMESFMYQNNTRIVTLSSDMKNHLLGKNINPEKISIIGNWVDTDEIRYIPRSENPLFDRFGLNKNQFYVTYSGNLGHAQDIHSILEAAGILQKEVPEIHFLIIGSGVLEEKFKSQALFENLHNLKFFPLQPDQDSALVYSIGDIGLVTLKKDMDGKAMPSKIWAMMAASQPLICTTSEGTELSAVIRASGCGLPIPPEDSVELARQIKALFHRPDFLRDYGKQGRDYAVKYCSRSAATKKYYDLMAEMAKGRG